MINNYKELKRKEFLFEIINDVINVMDVYNHNGSLWLIKTEESKWAIEFTKDKTLWYNYNLFKNLFKAISLDISENQKYVTEWFESRFLKPEVVEDTIQNGVRHTVPIPFSEFHSVEYTIQNGVRHTGYAGVRIPSKVKDAIQNGVKHTHAQRFHEFVGVEDTIENGVKKTKSMCGKRNGRVDNIVQNGVKHTEDGDWLDGDERIGDIIQEGVKETIPTLRRTLLGVDDIVQNGVKETHEDVYHHRHRIFGVIKNGVKEVQPLPAQDGNMDWGNYYNGKEDRTKTFNSYLNDTITYGKKIIKNDK